jgi:hypothetical protein
MSEIKNVAAEREATLRRLLNRRRSPSSISAILTCPLAWYCGATGKPMIKTDTRHLDLGTAVHEIIANYYRRQTPDMTLIQRKELIDDLFARNAKLSILDNMKTKISDVNAGFKKFETQRLKVYPGFEPSFIEKRLSNNRFVCITDLYSKPNKLGLDWKTGRVTEIDMAKQIQAAVNYRMLDESENPCDHFVFIGLVGGTMVEAPKPKKEWIEAIDDSVIEIIRKGEFPATPHEWCSGCPSQIRCAFREVDIWDELYIL